MGFELENVKRRVVCECGLWREKERAKGTKGSGWFGSLEVGEKRNGYDS